MNNVNKHFHIIMNEQALARLKIISRQQGMRTSDFIRDAIAQRCKDLGYEIDLQVGNWGGQRKGSGKKKKRGKLNGDSA